MKTASRARWIGTLLGALAIVLLAPPFGALAHGGPTLTVKETTVAPGATITLSGDGLGENGQAVTLTLRGATYQKVLGTATLKDDAFDDQTFTVPTDAPPGTYVVECKNGSITATAQIDVIAAGGAPGASMPVQNAGTVSVSRSPVEWSVSVGLVLLVAGTALVLLWRSRRELTAIDV